MPNDHLAAAMEGTSVSSNEPQVSSPSTTSSTCALVPFSFRNPFHDALRDATRWFPIAGKRIRIDQAWQSDGKGGTALGFGASVYDAAVALSLYLASHRELVEGSRVIELGSGPGLVGVVAAHLEPKSVVITDGDPASVALTQRNIQVNSISGEVCTAEEYLWGDLKHHLVPKVGGLEHYDVILGADIVACPYASAFDGLMKSLQEMAGLETLVLLAYKKRQNSEDKFFEKLEKVFEIDQVGHSELHPDFQNGDIVIFQARLKK
ncbi:Protein N-lysine methyltransferase METTL21A [Phytophthora citrophthora]|uniref:Protein N-lysine methyltransferase METTL21A n=1 Tax=Phytophthora citrophthora TaxID=4793 RepID=A0AAD9LV96_9STRA|nr:Protein N-lysine methyltransferase METTL21A [Phytophthora citrophthora]